MNYYEINVARNGKHFFATAKRSITTKHELLKVFPIIKQKFPESEGYEISVEKWEETGRKISTSVLDFPVVSIRTYLQKYFNITLSDEAIDIIKSKDMLEAAMDVECFMAKKPIYYSKDIIKAFNIEELYYEDEESVSEDDRNTLDGANNNSAQYWTYHEDDFDYDDGCNNKSYVKVKLSNGLIIIAQIPNEI